MIFGNGTLLFLRDVQLQYCFNIIAGILKEMPVFNFQVVNFGLTNGSILALEPSKRSTSSWLRCTRSIHWKRANGISCSKSHVWSAVRVVEPYFHVSQQMSHQSVCYRHACWTPFDIVCVCLFSENLKVLFFSVDHSIREGATTSRVYAFFITILLGKDVDIFRGHRLRH